MLKIKKWYVGVADIRFQFFHALFPLRRLFLRVLNKGLSKREPRLHATYCSAMAALRATIDKTVVEEALQWEQKSNSTVAASLALTLLVVAAGTIAWFRSTRKRTDKILPPSPWAVPLIGNLHQLGGSPHRSLASLASRHGPLMMVRFGSARYLIVTTADAAREVMKTHDLSFSSRPYMTAGDRLLYGCRDVAISPYGEHWRQARRVCVLHLLTASRLRQLCWVREGEVATMMRKVEAGASEGKAVNISTAILDLNNNIASLVALGKSYWGEMEGATAESGRRVRELVQELLKLVGGFNIADFIPSLAWVNWLNGFERRAAMCKKGIDEMLEEVINERIRVRDSGIGSTVAKAGGAAPEQTADGSNFVDILLSLEELDSEGNSLFDRDTIKAILLDMFVAGTHTTSTVIDWTMTELMRNPAVRIKLTKEIRSTCSGARKTLLSEDDIERVPYLHCVTKEILRMHPPFPLLAPRETTEDVQVMGYHIAKGTKVMINAWAIQQDPKSWERSGEFRPERFADGTVDFKGFDFQLIPFGSGRRGCPGQLFAMQIVHLAVANLLYHYDWEMPDGMTAADLDMSEAFGLTSCRKYNLTLMAKKAALEAA